MIMSGQQTNTLLNPFLIFSPTKFTKQKSFQGLSEPFWSGMFLDKGPCVTTADTHRMAGDNHKA